MKTYGSYYKFDSAVDFMTYFDKSYSGYYWNNKKPVETLTAGIYRRIIKKDKFPVFLHKEFDTQRMLGVYSLKTKGVGSLKREFISLRSKADALEDFLK